MATYSVTNTFTADTTAVASEVNQNFTDVLTALNAFDAGNLSSGTVPLARISGLTVTQLAAATIVLEAEGIESNDNDTTWPTCAAVKDAYDTADAGDHPAYTGGESHTDGSGLIMKMGNIVDSGSNTTPVSFAVAFPNALVSVVVTGVHNANTNEVLVNKDSKSKTGFTIRCETFRATSYDWIAIGH